MCWAALMAGGSCAAIPVTDERFLRSISTMKPSKTDDNYLLEGSEGMLVYKLNDDAWNAQPQWNGSYNVYQIDEKTGQLKRLRSGKGTVSIEGKGIFWLQKK